MGVDWFTLVAQIVNFLVLVWLLKHFLYGRIVGAMKEREAKIAGRLDEAARQRASAEAEAELFRVRNLEFEANREEMLARAGTSQAYRQQLMELRATTRRRSRWNGWRRWRVNGKDCCRTSANAWDRSLFAGPPRIERTRRRNPGGANSESLREKAGNVRSGGARRHHDGGA